MCRRAFGALALGLALGGCKDSLPVSPRPSTPHGSYVVAAIACSYVRGDSTVPCEAYGETRSRTLAAALAALRTQPPPTGGPISPAAVAPKGGVTRARSARSARSMYFGEQGVDVYLAIDSVTLVGTTFSFDATVQNLSTEPLGTVDGRTPASDSIMVFFSQVPVATSGTGTVAVTNPNGYNTFTEADQPYFEYPGLLPSNATTEPVSWRNQVSS